MAVACAIFFGYGLITSGIGPALPELATRTASSLADLGGMFTALFFGALITQLITGPISDRTGQRPVMFVGLLLLALGAAGATWSHMLSLTFASTVLAGLGAGAIVVTNNLLVAQLFPARSTSMLNLANVFYGIGAVLGPALAGQSLRLFGTALLAIWGGAALMLILMAAIVRLPDVQSVQAEAAADHAGPVWRSAALWMLGALVLLYVGMETGIGGWATAYMQRTTAQDVATAALTASAFWLALTGGRVIGTFAGMRLASATLLTICIGVALGGALLLQASIGHALLSTAAAVIMGLALGPIYPTALAITAATFRRGTGTATSIVMALGSVGGMSLPWLLLVLLERGPMLSTLLIVAGMAGMLALHIGRGRLGRQTMGAAASMSGRAGERVSR
jgi:fucose permease